MGEANINGETYPLPTGSLWAEIPSFETKMVADRVVYRDRSFFFVTPSIYKVSVVVSSVGTNRAFLPKSVLVSRPEKKK